MYLFFRGFLLFTLVFYGLSCRIGFANSPVEPVSEPIENTLISNYFFHVSYHRGILLPHHAYIGFYNEDYINGIELKFGRTFPEIREYRSPSMGLGFFRSNLGNSEVFGNITSLHVFFSSQYLERHRFIGISSTVGFGMSYLSTFYDKYDNPKNNAVGSALNVYISLSPELSFQLSPISKLVLSPSLIHASNGKIKLPNSGLNLYTLQLGLKFALGQFEMQARPLDYDNRNFLYLQYSLGWIHPHRFYDRLFRISASALEYHYLITPYLGLGMAANAYHSTYDAYRITHEENSALISAYSGAINLSALVVWDRFSFVIQPGFYFFKNNPSDKWRYDRIGIRYRFFDQFYLNCSLKSVEFTAEFIEWGLGYGLGF